MTRPRFVYPILLAFSFLLTAVGCTKNTTTTITTPVNKVPVVNAGISQSFELPDTITLAGSASDSDGQVVAYLWSEVSGPSAITIVDPGSPSTAATGFVHGVYVFQLMATDNGGATGVDTMSVTVTGYPATTITLAPSANPNEMQLVLWNGADHSGVSTDMPVEAWTNGGTAYTVRQLFKFDLSSIPAGATITSANLYLYSYPAPLANGNFTDANYGTNNAMLVQQVTSAWSPSTTTWFNAPTTDPNSQITVPSTTQSFLDLNIDVTAMVGSMVTSNANYGFELKLQSETEYTSRIFVSSQNTTYPDKHPKLVVSYH